MRAFIVEAGRVREVTLRPGPQTRAVLKSDCAALRARAHVVLLTEAAEAGRER